MMMTDSRERNKILRKIAGKLRGRRDIPRLLTISVSPLRASNGRTSLGHFAIVFHLRVLSDAVAIRVLEEPLSIVFENKMPSRNEFPGFALTSPIRETPKDQNARIKHDSR